jgi:hypothetical protein
MFFVLMRMKIKFLPPVTKPTGNHIWTAALRIRSNLVMSSPLSAVLIRVKKVKIFEKLSLIQLPFVPRLQ